MIASRCVFNLRKQRNRCSTALAAAYERFALFAPHNIMKMIDSFNVLLTLNSIVLSVLVEY